MNKIRQATADLSQEISLLRPIEIVESKGSSEVAINRRRRRLVTLTKRGFILNRIYMGPNYFGETDSEVRRLDFIDHNRSCLAIIWTLACHPTSFYSEDSVSSHFPGRVRTQLRKQFPNSAVLFLQGFAGDLRPKSISGFKERPLRFLLSGPTFRLFREKEYFRFTNQISTDVLNTKKFISQEKGITISKRIELPVNIFVRDSPVRSVVIQKFSVGSHIFIGISGEPLVGLSKLVKKSMGKSDIWTCGYLEDVYGYIPSDKQIVEGGYEGRDFANSFGCGEPEIGAWDRILNELRAM